MMLQICFIQALIYNTLNPLLINKLSISLTNINYLIISSSRIGGHIHIHKIALESQLKYLGIFIDQNVHWGLQIQHISNKLMKHVGIINKL